MPTHLDNNQVWFMARQVEDPSKISAMLPVWFGDNAIQDDELAEKGEGRIWDNYRLQCIINTKHRFMVNLTHVVSILLEGKPLFRDLCYKVEITEVNV